MEEMSYIDKIRKEVEDKENSSRRANKERSKESKRKRSKRKEGKDKKSKKKKSKKRKKSKSRPLEPKEPKPVLREPFQEAEQGRPEREEIQEKTPEKIERAVESYEEVEAPKEIKFLDVDNLDYSEAIAGLVSLLVEFNGKIDVEVTPSEGGNDYDPRIGDHITTQINTIIDHLRAD